MSYRKQLDEALRVPRELKYRGYIISQDRQKAPGVVFNWEWHHEGYDGPPDPRNGYSKTLEDAMDEIDLQIDEAGMRTQRRVKPHDFGYNQDDYTNTF